MRKKAFLLITLFLSVSIFAQDVKVTHNLPSSANAGETIEGQFTVTKGNIGAFAKFQCDVPAGTQAVAGDTKSGNFTFENNRIKIVWVSLPGDATFNFTVKITLASSASGSLSFTSAFYYLENNIKKEFNLPPHTITIGGGTSTATTPTVSPVETKTTTPVETNTVATTTTPTTTPVETNTVATTTTPTTTPVETNTVATTPVETKTTTPTDTKSATRPGLVYHIQVAALSTDPGMQYKRYGKMKVVVEGGMYKVLVGEYKTLEEARSHKAEIASKGAAGCFVVAYENGVRVKP